MEKPLPDGSQGANQNRQKSRPLFLDVTFWMALLLGLASCWILALLLGRTGNVALPWTQWRLLLWLVLLYPVLEEWVFRGVLQPWLRSGCYGRAVCCGISLANVGTTLLFAGAHLVTHTPLWAVLVIVPSLVYGWFRDRYNSILPGIVLHCGYNLGYFALFGLPSAS